jgi:hypothetical protein
MNEYDLKFKNILQIFLILEKKYNLFEMQYMGIYFWEIVRYPLFRRLLREYKLHGDNQVPNKYLNRFKFGRFKNFMLSLTLKNPLFFSRGSVLIFAHPRKKKENKHYTDIYTDIFNQYIPDGEEYQVLEKPFSSGFHYSPTLQKPIYYLDLYIFIASILLKFLPKKQTRDIKDLCQNLKNEIHEAIDIEVDFDCFIHDIIEKHIIEKKIYIWLFSILKPKYAFVVASSIYESVIAALKYMNVPCIELQHGSPSPGKLNYDYPVGVFKHNFPDYFLSFGEYWTSHVNLPIAKNHIINFGFPYLEHKKNLYKNLKKKETLIVISQPTISNPLIDFTCQLSRLLPENVEIIFKMHPQEYIQFEKNAELLKNNVSVVSTDEPELHELLATSKWVIGVYSTALYEALFFDCKVFVYELPGASYLNDLIESHAISKINKAEDFILKMNSTEINANKDPLFTPTNKNILNKLLYPKITI